MNIAAATNGQPLAALIQGKNRGMMPAKSISWRWEPGLSEAQVTEAKVYYNGYQQGSLLLNDEGEWVGSMQFTVRDLEGQVETITATTCEGMESLAMAGKQLAYKFHRATKAAGFSWKW